MRTYLQNVDVSAQVGAVDTCAEKFLGLESIVQKGTDFVLPLRSNTICLP